MTLIVTARCTDCMGSCEKSPNSNGWLCMKTGGRLIQPYPPAEPNPSLDDIMRAAEKLTGSPFAHYQEEMLRAVTERQRVQELAYSGKVTAGMKQRLGQWCTQSRLHQAAWEEFQHQPGVEYVLDDSIAGAFMHTFNGVMIELTAKHEATLQVLRSLYEMLINAASELVERFPEADTKQDLVYMAETVEELDALLFDIQEALERGATGPPR